MIELRENFDIPGSTPQMRRLGRGGTHPSEGLRQARAAWQALLERHRPERPMDRPVFLMVKLCYHSAARGGMRPKTTRPDGDNLLKIIKDAATRAGWWRDDALVYSESMERYFWPDADEVTICAVEQPLAPEPWGGANND